MTLIKKTAHPDADLIIKDALRELTPGHRRLFLRRGLTLGGIAMLTGCDVQITSRPSIDRVLKAMSRFNDVAQAALFDPNLMAPTYSESEVSRPFPFNAFYPMSRAPHVDGDSYRLQLTGLIENKTPWALADLYAMPQTQQITRHICVEGWSAIGHWGGVHFSDFLKRIGADTTARYIDFQCADGYHTSIDMPTALHPQTLLTLSYDNSLLPREFGFPMKLRMPTKLGYKNPKHIMVMNITNTYPGGYWEDQGYNWFGGS
jgi:DMSO/TMAO reductase YedYZ molybdopterin-dependent catalytic subunit